MNVDYKGEQVFRTVKWKEDDSDSEVSLELQEIIDEGRKNFLTSIEVDEENHYEKKDLFPKKNAWKPITGNRDTQSSSIQVSVAYDDNDDISDYELKRLQNIQEKQKLFLDQMKKSANALKPQQTTISNTHKGKIVKGKGKVYFTRRRKSDCNEKYTPELPMAKLRFETECADFKSNCASTKNNE